MDGFVTVKYKSGAFGKDSPALSRSIYFPHYEPCGHTGQPKQIFEDVCEWVTWVKNQAQQNT